MSSQRQQRQGYFLPSKHFICLTQINQRTATHDDEHDTMMKKKLSLKSEHLVDSFHESPATESERFDIYFSCWKSIFRKSVDE